jgi:hypothetical protein
MNASLIASFVLRGFAFAVIAILILALTAGPTFAATSIDHSQAPACFAAYFNDVGGNRAKIIQLSIVFVMIGIALLFKK